MKQKLARGAGILLAAAFLLGLARAPEVCAGAVREGLSLCLSTLIPALFPFFAVSGLLTRLGAVDRLGRLMAPVTGTLFRLRS